MCICTLAWNANECLIPTRKYRCPDPAGPMDTLTYVPGHHANLPQGKYPCPLAGGLCTWDFNKTIRDMSFGAPLNTQNRRRMSRDLSNCRRECNTRQLVEDCWDCCPTHCPKKNVGTDPLRDYSDAGQKNLHSKPPVVGRGSKIVCVANFSCASASLRQISHFAQHSPPNRRCAISRYKPNKNKLGSGRVQLTQLASE